MREVKFRAWVKSLKCFRHWEEILWNKLGNYFKWPDMYELNQFTGLKDKNGREIYEGDITREHCKELDFIGADGIISVVYFENGMFQLKEVGYEGTDLILLSDSCDCLEVIGNVHENPELLEGVQV